LVEALAGPMRRWEALTVAVVNARALAVLVLLGTGLTACGTSSAPAAQDTVRCPSHDPLSCYNISSNRPVHGVQSVSYQGQTVPVVGQLPFQCGITYQQCALLATIPIGLGNTYRVWNTATNGGGYYLQATYQPGTSPSSGGSGPATANPTNLRVQVTSVTATLLPFNPQLSNRGIPAEHIDFTVSGLPPTSAPSSFRCDIEVFHSGRQVGMTSFGTGAPPDYITSSQSVGVAVTGGSFAGRPSDAHISCRVL
jgi:hypothetical protein